MNKILETQLVRAKVQVWNMATSEYDKTWMQGFVAPAYINENGPVLGLFTTAKDGLVFSGCEQEVYTTKYFGETAVFWETLGRYTGVKDKNGRRIFEGDVVKTWCENDYKVVKWFDCNCGFEPFSDSFGNCGRCGCGEIAEKCEVVGNIHDNPELLNKVTKYPGE